MRSPRKILLLLLAAGGLSLSSAKALEAIGWNYDHPTYANDTLASADVAGQAPYAQSNWNNHTGSGNGPANPTSLPFALKDNSGAATTAQVKTWTTTGSNGYRKGISDGDSNNALTNAYTRNAPSVTFSNIPASYQSSGYTVVVYYSSVGGSQSLTLTGNVNDSRTLDITTPIAAHAFYSSYCEVFTGLDDPEITVATTAGLFAIQIVKEEGAPSVPVDPNPLDDEYGLYPIAVSSDLFWTASKRATRYDVYLWKAEDPEPVEPTDSTLANSYDPPSPLDPLTDYRWKVVAVNESGDAPGEIWHFSTGDGGLPDEPLYPYPDIAETGISIETILQWNPAPKATSYEVYLWPSSELPPSEPIWTGTDNYIELPAALQILTEYNWQVVAVNDQGSTGGEVWSFTTSDFYVAGHPSIGWNYDHGSRTNDGLAPAEGAGAPGFGQLNWNNHAGSGNGPGTVPFALKDALGAPTTAQVTAWSVVGTANGWTYGYTGTQGNGKMMNAYIGNQPSLTFSNIPTAYQSNGYSVVVYFNPGSSGGSLTLTGDANDSRSLAIPSGMTASAWETAGFVSGTNYTVFTGLDDSGFTLGTNVRGIMGVQIVQESGAPATPINPVPADATSEIASNVNFSWEAAPRAATYDIYLWKTSEPEPITATASGLTTPFYDSPADLDVSTEYFWRVDAINVDGTTTGTVWTFTTGADALPDEVTNLTPANSSAGLSLAPTFTWNVAARAASYEIFIWESSENAPEDATASLETTTYTVSAPLTGGTRYSWRIDALNATGRTPGQEWSFTTGFPPAQAITPMPADGTLDQPRLVTALDWEDVPTATSYRVFFWPATDSEPSSPAAIITDSEFIPSSLLAPNTAYSWRIDPVNAFGITTGHVWTFTTNTVVTTQESIGWSYDHPNYSNDTLSDTDVAGAYPQAYWNNHTGSGNGPALSGSLPFALIDSTGAATTAQVTAWTTTANNGYRRGNTDTSPNSKLLNAYIRNAPSLTFSDLPASYVESGYMVVVYYSAVGGSQSITLTGSQDDVRTLDITTPVPGHLFNGSYCEIFEGLNDPEVTVATTAGFFAIQVIKNADTSTGNPFEAWAADAGLVGGDAAFDADPDGDGLDNGIEFLLGGQPNPAEPGSNSLHLLPTVEASGENLVFTFTRAHAAADIEAIVEFSATLDGQWTEATELNATIVVTPGEDSDTVQVTIPKGSEAKLFARLRAVDPTPVP